MEQNFKKKISFNEIFFNHKFLYRVIQMKSFKSIAQYAE